MSIVNSHDVKVDLPRVGIDPFWDRLLADAAGDDQRLRDLAMLALREVCHWPMLSIGRAMGRHKGQVSRVVKRVKAEIREQYHLHDEQVP